MNKNKLVIAMAAAALMSSMSAVAANTDTFEAIYTVNDGITINIQRDVELSPLNIDETDGSVRGNTEFCVGAVGADTTAVDYEVTVTSTNGYELQQSGLAPLSYELHHSFGSAFNTATPIESADDIIDSSTSITMDTCNSNPTGSGYMWVSIPPASQAAAVSGQYTDTVTMTVAAQ